MKQRQEILDAQSSDTKLFHKLVNKQRGSSRHCVNELSVNGQVYKTDITILDGWRDHFKSLATPSNEIDSDKKYSKLVEDEIPVIIELCKDTPATIISSEQVKKAIKSLNRGKAADYYGVTVEHFIHGGEALIDATTEIVNSLFRFGRVTEALKIGTLTPVFKKKGSSTEAKNYRGITVLPVVTKILEAVLKDLIQPKVEEHQNTLQRGFTRHSSPMNCSLIMEEVIRDRKDRGQPMYAAFLDVKAAFDVVPHDSLMRHLFHTGVDGKTWSLIHSLHEGAESVVKWQGNLSEPFKVHQGVRQGGILSTDLFKVHGNGLLDRLVKTGRGCHIGEICCVAPTCADDMLLLSDTQEALQFLMNIAVDNSIMEKYLLQPVKSVLLCILNALARRSAAVSEPCITLKEEPMPVVNETMHMGILRSSNTEDTVVRENIAKARRTLYSLMASGLHGENGLDPETCTHLLQIYILPVLVYGLEVVLPKASLMDKVNRAYKKSLKQILSLPDTVADPAVYIISGALPIEGIVDKRALVFFGSICRLPESATEKRLARRQLAVKDHKSNSWYIAVRKILVKYNLPSCWDLLDNPPKKEHWRRLVNKHVNEQWAAWIKQSAELYSSLKYLCADEYWPGNRHQLIRHVNGPREVPRVSTRLKLATGTYILQSTRAAFNQNAVDPTCMLCGQAPETVEHFLVECSALEDTRQPIIEELQQCCSELLPETHVHNDIVQIILDPSRLIPMKRGTLSPKQIDLHRQAKRLCHSLHLERYQKLAIIPSRKMKRHKRTDGPRHTIS